MKISELLSEVTSRDLVLPEFQREYVWNREQARQLMVSLLKGYPVGSLLFWKTGDPPELKNVDELPDRLGTVQVILDGQQRLTTLFLLMAGAVPPYYTERDIQNDPRDLCFNLDTGEFQYYLKSRMEKDPLWQRVVDCFNPDHEINVFAIGKQLANGDDNRALKLAEHYHANLTRLRNIRERDVPHQTVPSNATITEAIDIFDRTNSQGTKLTDAELALTHVTAKWAEARRVLKDKIAELEKRHFHFDLTFMIRALTAITCRRALFETIHERSREDVESGWRRLSKRLDYLVTTLPSQAFIHSTDDLATQNVLVPLLLYLDLHEGAFANDRAMRHAWHWLYAAQMWQRYTSQTDQRLEHDLSIVVREDWPWQTLCNQIIDQRGRIEVKPADLEGRWISHPMFKMAVVTAKAHGAIDWFNGAPLGTVFGKSYQLHAHHIFPQALLYQNGYDSDNHLHRKVINEIANRAFLTAETNLKLSDTPPSEYLPDVQAKYPEALTRQFVPVEPSLWTVDRFSDFLAARREIIARKINEFMACLVSEPEDVSEKTAAELCELEESATLEFKSSLQWDVIQQQKNKELRFSVLKTIVAFLNSDGGTLLLGVDDSGTPVGLEPDLKLLSAHSVDAFQQTLTNLVLEHVGAEFAPLVKIRFEQVGGEHVCIIEVSPASGPAFLVRKHGQPREFFVRFGNTSRSLDTQDALSYIDTHWQ